MRRPKKSFRPFSISLLSALALLPSLELLADTPQDYRYKVEVLVENIPQPLEMERAPDGRIFYIELAGKLKVYHPDTRLVVEAGQLEVFSSQENGLLGMALDPQFATNGWIYFLHSPKDFSGQVISRFTMKGDQLDLNSGKDLLSYAEQRRECCHHAGALRFGPDGCLYASSGDNTNPFQSDGYSPHDDRPDRDPWDAQKSAANTNDLRGKIIRIKPKADGTYEIPQGNLFPPGTPNTRPEIFAMGFRNPWRFNIDPKTGIVYVGDVGPDSGKTDEQRGPVGFDTINQVRKPGYFGWPYSRGNISYVAYDFDKKAPGATFDPLKPTNASKNNTGLKDLPPVQAPLIWYPPGESKEFPILGKGGRTACAGPVYHFNSKFRETNGLPEAFDNCLLIYDWSRPFILWVRLDDKSNMAGIEPFTSAFRVDQKDDDGTDRVQIKRPVDMFIDPDGVLYIMDYGETWGPNKDSRLVKISYQRGNLAPIAKASASLTAGREPLTLELSSAGSKDPEGDPVTYEWRLQPSGKVIAQTASTKLTLAEPGSYRAELRVTDSSGATGMASVPIVVGNTPPEVHFESPQEGDFFTPGKPIKFSLKVHDAEDGDSTEKPAEMGFRTLVSTAWKGRDGKSAPPEPGFALMKQSDCFNCHTVEQRLVGPALMEVAAKYRGQAGAENATVQRVIHGSTGVWGQVGMLPHPQHTEDEVHQMVQWVFSLEAGKNSTGLVRGLTGEVPVPKNDKSAACVLEAYYTDAGRPPAGALTGKASLTLRSRRIEAEAADEIHGPSSMQNGSASGKKMVGSISDKNYLRFTQLNLADTPTITFRVASGGSGGKIEVHAGSVTGELLGEAEVQPTGGWGKWVDVKAPLKAPAQLKGDIYLVFVNPGKGGLMNMDWVQFGN